MAGIGRRKFTQIISAAGLAGAALAEKMYGEMQDTGALSRESVRSFLDLSGMKVKDDQLIGVHASLERALDGMKRIRERSLSHTLPPAVTFRARR